MKDLLQNKIITGLVVTATFILAGVAVFTAIRLYQIRDDNVTPTTPTQSDASGTLSPPTAPRVVRDTTWKPSDPADSGETQGSLEYASSKDEAWIAVRNNGSSSVLIKGWQNCPPRHDPTGICWPKAQDPTFEFTIKPKEVVRVEAVQVCGQLDFDQPYGYGRYFDTITCSGSTTSTPTPSVKITASITPYGTKTPTPTVKTSLTPTGTKTPSATPTGTTPVPQSCKALTFTLSGGTGTPTPTGTKVVTKTPTPTSTGTITVTPTGSTTGSPTPTDVPRGGGDTPTNTPTPTNTQGPTPTTGSNPTTTPTTGVIAGNSPTPGADLPNAGFALPTLFAAGLGGIVMILAIALAL